MANEARILSSLTLRKVSNGRVVLEYQNRPATFIADVDGAKGPTPGAFAVSIYGTDCDLSELTQPGLAVFKNLDDTNWVEYGIRDPETLKFYPLGALLPGEEYVIRLSPNLYEEYPEVGTGTGTSGAGTNTLRFRANYAGVNVSVEAFEA